MFLKKLLLNKEFTSLQKNPIYSNTHVHRIFCGDKDVNYVGPDCIQYLIK